MNPRLSVFSETVFSLPKSTESLIILYENTYAKIFIYKENTNENSKSFVPDEKSISLDKLCEISEIFANLPLVVNHETLEVFNRITHRRLTFLRLLIPECRYQISYEDGLTTSGDADKEVSEKMRFLLKRA